MVDQERRKLIKAVGALGTGAALAGCSGDGQSNPEGELNGSTLEPTAGQEATKSPEPTAGNTTVAGSSDSSSSLYNNFVDPSELANQNILASQRAEGLYDPKAELNRHKGVYLTESLLNSLNDDLESSLVEISKEEVRDQCGIGFLENSSLRDESWRTNSGYTFQHMGAMQYNGTGEEYRNRAQTNQQVSEYSEDREEGDWTTASFTWDEPGAETIQDVRVGVKDNGKVVWASDYEESNGSQVFSDLDGALRLKRKTVDGELPSALENDKTSGNVTRNSMNESEGKQMVEFGYGDAIKDQSPYTGFTRRYELDGNHLLFDGWKYNEDGKMTNREVGADTTIPPEEVQDAVGLNLF